MLCQTHSRTKLSGYEFSSIPETNEPFKILLKDTFTTNSVCRKNRIQTGFGSVRLPTTIVKFNETFTNFGNQVPWRKTNATSLNISTMVFADFHCLPFSRFSIALFIWDSILRIKSEVKELGDVVGSSPLHSSKIVDFGGSAKILCHFADWPPYCPFV